ncbi:MAG: transglycosylase [Bacteroidota bacterium]
MKKIGIVLLVIGIIGLIIFGIDAWQQSESFSVAGVEVAVSKANWSPVIASGAVAVLGVIFAIIGKK